MAEYTLLKKINFEILSLAVLNNLDYFYFVKGKYWYADKYVISLQLMLNHLQWYETRIEHLSNNVHRFDFNEHIKGNGFRSFDLIFDRYFTECFKFCKELSAARGSMFFMADSYLKELSAHVNVLEGLKPGLHYLLKMIDENHTNQLLTINKHLTAEQLIKEYGLLNQMGFYGRCHGFYFCGSMRKTLWGVNVIMASFSDLYQNTGGPLSRAISAIINGLKYIRDPELRSQQIVNVAQNASVEFLKSFWSLSETHFMKQLPKWICPKLEVLEELFIPAEPITLIRERTNETETVVIPVPSSYIPSAPVRCLLLSSVWRKGQISKGQLNHKLNATPMSSSLLFHCHGGGFISQTPESHEIYLRNWAYELNIPILSIDYSLAPAAPFPRALEEVLLAYAWALKNAESLGWTGERVCFAGDSAGGNILMGIVLKTISLRIRSPDAILCAYTPLILDMVPSPSRLLCWLDPLLPLGFMLSCLDAYAGAMHTANNEYIEEPKKKSNSSRERKLSSISEILDSSMIFLKEEEWTEVEPNEPETHNSTNTVDFSASENLNNYIGSNSNRLLEALDTSNEHNDYVSCFITNYACDSQDIKCEGQVDDSKEHLLFNFPQDIIYDIRQKSKNLLQQAVGQVTDIIGQNKLYKKYILPFMPKNPLTKSRTYSSSFSTSESSIISKIKKLKIVSRNPYMSPLLVSDDVLKEMPPIYFMSLNFDPCLDDSVTFAKRMATVGKPVVIDILDGLPHGFLNFLPFSQEAHDGSDLCVRRIKEALQLGDNSNQ